MIQVVCPISSSLGRLVKTFDFVDSYRHLHPESEKVLNVPSILRETVLMFLIVEHLGDCIFNCKIC